MLNIFQSLETGKSAENGTESVYDAQRCDFMCCANTECCLSSAYAVHYGDNLLFSVRDDTFLQRVESSRRQNHAAVGRFARCVIIGISCIWRFAHSTFSFRSLSLIFQIHSALWYAPFGNEMRKSSAGCNVQFTRDYQSARFVCRIFGQPRTFPIFSISHIQFIEYSGEKWLQKIFGKKIVNLLISDWFISWTFEHFDFVERTLDSAFCMHQL